MLNIGLEQQQQIRGADGNLLWSGAQVIATSYIAKSGEASATMAMGEPAVWDPATVNTGFIPRQETTAVTGYASDLPGSLTLGCKRTQASAAADVCFLGVAQEPVGPGKSGFIAGPGSLTTVKSEAATIAIGTPVQGSATAGSVQPAGTKSATVPAYGTVLGIAFKTNTAGATGTGSTLWVGILVAPA